MAKNKFSRSCREIKEEPIIIEEEDSIIFGEHYDAQELSEGEAILFQSDDPTTVFQVFKISEPPESYDDFIGSMKEYDTAVMTNAAASSFSLVDNNVSANTKYYYTFRTKDTHGNISNPSPVYELEIVDNSGAIYLLVNLFKFKDPDAELQTTKNVQRYISIIPTHDQMVFNEEATEDTQPAELEAKSATKMEPILGFAEDSLFNRGARKYFKVRLISKKTGKKIDFNLDFVYEHKNSEVKKPEDISDSHSSTTPN